MFDKTMRLGLGAAAVCATLLTGGCAGQMRDAFLQVLADACPICGIGAAVASGAVKHDYELIDQMAMTDKLPDSGVQDDSLNAALKAAAEGIYATEDTGKPTGVEVLKIILTNADWTTFHDSAGVPRHRNLENEWAVVKYKDSCALLLGSVQQECANPDPLTNECNGWSGYGWAGNTSADSDEEQNLLKVDHRISCDLVK